MEVKGANRPPPRAWLEGRAERGLHVTRNGSMGLLHSSRYPALPVGLVSNLKILVSIGT